MIVLPMDDFLMDGPPGGSQRHIRFELGNIRPVTPEDPYIAPTEGPVHPVTIDMPVAMRRNEVTHDQWMACVDDGGCGGHIPRDCILQPHKPCVKVVGNPPVVDVPYLDAVSYTNWLNSKVGANVYRLRTGAEWEFAARAGTQTPFAQGEEDNTDQANFRDDSTEEMLGEK